MKEQIINRLKSVETGSFRSYDCGVKLTLVFNDLDDFPKNLYDIICGLVGDKIFDYVEDGDISYKQRMYEWERPKVANISGRISEW